ncbi:MAG: chromate efflux transporter [Gammaproteobacteria bacterium]|nr:chromate efflux transporter [Gammaproteobacteria bacterium]
MDTVPLREAIKVWAKIGLLSFGGPAGQIALMHRILVEEKKWISDERFLHALNFCMLLPGPEAQQLATYIGWLLHRIRGGLIAGVLFILPGFIVILGLSYLYVTAGNLPLVQGLFLGLKTAVIAIVLQAVIRIGRRSLNTAMLFVLALSAFAAMFVFGVPFPYVILAAAVIGLTAARLKRHEANAFIPDADKEQRLPESSLNYSLKIMLGFGFLWLAPVAVLLIFLGPENIYSDIGVFFSKMAVVTFGGAYAVLSYVAQEAVQAHAWLAPGEMIDGLAMAETTPGPLIMVVQFVGFMAAYRDPGLFSPGTAAFFGSILTTWVTFAPCFLWIFLGAPHIEQLRRNKLLTGAFSAVTAAVVGVIVNLAAWFSIHTLFSETNLIRDAGMSLEVPLLASIRIPALLITIIALLLVFKFKRSIPVVLTVTGALGMIAFQFWQ